MKKMLIFVLLIVGISISAGEPIRILEVKDCLATAAGGGRMCFATSDGLSYYSENGDNHFSKYEDSDITMLNIYQMVFPKNTDTQYMEQVICIFKNKEAGSSSYQLYVYDPEQKKFTFKDDYDSNVWIEENDSGKIVVMKYDENKAIVYDVLNDLL